MVSFKGDHFEVGSILVCVRWYLASPLSYHHKAMMEERGIELDPSTLQRWALKYTPQLERELRKRQEPVGKN